MTLTGIRFPAAFSPEGTALKNQRAAACQGSLFVTEILISGGAVERTCVQDRRFSVTALCFEGGDEREAAKLKASLINLGRFDEDPWPLIDGCGDHASELCELLYDRYEKAGEPERIREPLLFIEGAEDEKEALPI